MNYGGAGVGILPVTGLGFAVAGHHVVLGAMIGAAVWAVAVGCALYRVGTWKKRIDAAE